MSLLRTWISSLLGRVSTFLSEHRESSLVSTLALSIIGIAAYLDSSPSPLRPRSRSRSRSSSSASSSSSSHRLCLCVPGDLSLGEWKDTSSSGSSSPRSSSVVTDLVFSVPMVTVASAEPDALMSRVFPRVRRRRLTGREEPNDLEDELWLGDLQRLVNLLERDSSSRKKMRVEREGDSYLLCLLQCLECADGQIWSSRWGILLASVLSNALFDLENSQYMANLNTEDGVPYSILLMARIVDDSTISSIRSRLLSALASFLAVSEHVHIIVKNRSFPELFTRMLSIFKTLEDLVFEYQSDPNNEIDCENFVAAFMAALSNIFTGHVGSLLSFSHQHELMSRLFRFLEISWIEPTTRTNLLRCISNTVSCFLPSSSWRLDVESLELLFRQLLVIGENTEDSEYTALFSGVLVCLRGDARNKLLLRELGSNHEYLLALVSHLCRPLSFSARTCLWGALANAFGDEVTISILPTLVPSSSSLQHHPSSPMSRWDSSNRLSCLEIVLEELVDASPISSPNLIHMILNVLNAESNLEVVSSWGEAAASSYAQGLEKKFSQLETSSSEATSLKSYVEATVADLLASTSPSFVEG